MRHRTTARAGLAVVFLAAVAGCGSSDSTDTTSGDPSGAEAIAAPATTDRGDDAVTDDDASKPVDTPADETAAAPTTAPAGEAPTPDADDEVVVDDAEDATAEDAAVEAVPGVIDVSLTTDERTAAESPIAQAITAAFPPGFAPPSEEQAECVGGKIVNELGTERLAELGITSESIDIFGATDFTPDEVDAMVDILFECVDVQFMVASMFAPSAGADTADCFADFVDEELIRDLAGPFLGGGALDANFFLEQVAAANDACLPADG